MEIKDLQSICLWPADAPGIDTLAVEQERPDGPGRLTNVRNPALLVYEPEPARRNGTAVVVCPGGGYGMVSLANEGYPIGEWLAGIGVCAYVLKYRLPCTTGVNYRHPVPLSDLQRAIRMVRRSAKEKGIRQDRVGVMGFSAGGHLAATGLTFFHEPVHRDEVSCRPDFGILVYPVISFLDDGLCHKGSRDSLAGPDASREVRTRLTPFCQVAADTPPVFLAHARNDGSVPCGNSERMFCALREKGVRTELRIYEQGGHGFGMGNPTHDSSRWPAAAEAWMRGLGRPIETSR
jgi:acetyl esterase/lipase